jgi:hypothetical protein
MSIDSSTAANNWWRRLSLNEKLIVYHESDTEDRNITFAQFAVNQKLIAAAYLTSSVGK